MVAARPLCAKRLQRALRKSTMAMFAKQSEKILRMTPSSSSCELSSWDLLDGERVLKRVFPDVCVYEEFISLVAAGEVLLPRLESALADGKKQAEGIVEYLR